MAMFATNKIWNFYLKTPNLAKMVNFTILYLGNLTYRSKCTLKCTLKKKLYQTDFRYFFKDISLFFMETEFLADFQLSKLCGTADKQFHLYLYWIHLYVAIIGNPPRNSFRKIHHQKCLHFYLLMAYFQLKSYYSIKVLWFTCRILSAPFSKRFWNEIFIFLSN